MPGGLLGGRVGSVRHLGGSEWNGGPPQLQASQGRERGPEKLQAWGTQGWRLHEGEGKGARRKVSGEERISEFHSVKLC